MRMLRLAILFAALLACLASVLGPGEDIPQPDLCDGASQTGVEALSILWASSDGAESELQDYQELSTVSGSQGGSMLRFLFRLDGSSVPACASFEFQLEHCADLLCETTIQADGYLNQASLGIYEDDGSHITKDFYFILPYQYESAGTLARLRVRVGQAEQQTLIWIENQSSFPDAGITQGDGGVNDGGLADGGSPDAALAIDAGP